MADENSKSEVKFFCIEPKTSQTQFTKRLSPRKAYNVLLSERAVKPQDGLYLGKILEKKQSNKKEKYHIVRMSLTHHNLSHQSPQPYITLSSSDIFRVPHLTKYVHCSLLLLETPSRAFSLYHRNK